MSGAWPQDENSGDQQRPHAASRSSSVEAPVAVTRRQLFAAIVALAVIPPLIVVSYVWLRPAPPEQPLSIEVAERVTTGGQIELAGDWNQTELYACLEILNPSDMEYRNVVVILNESFVHRLQGPLAAGGRQLIPLRTFVTKDGGIPMPQRTHRLTDATIFAQLPQGTRAVAEKELSTAASSHSVISP